MKKRREDVEAERQRVRAELECLEMTIHHIKDTLATLDTLTEDDFVNDGSIGGAR